jgi:hypothetical protein
MVIAGIFLLGRKLPDPTFYLPPQQKRRFSSAGGKIGFLKENG